METYERLRDLVGADKIARVIPGHDMQTFIRHRNWLTGLNPVAEVHLAKGEASRKGNGAPFVPPESVTASA